MHGRIHGFCLIGFVTLAVLVVGCETPNAKEGEFNRVKRGLRSGEADKSTLVTTEHPIEAETQLAAGRLHESQNRPDDAIEQYRAAIASEPNLLAAYDRLASLLDRLGRFKESEDVYQEALKRIPDQAFLHNNLGFSYILQRRWSEAENALYRAIELKPDFARAHVNLALALAQQDRFDEAFPHFQAVLPAEDAHFNMGLMYQSRRKPVEAAKSFKTALELNPNLTAARDHLKKLPTEVLSKADDLLRSEKLAAASVKQAAPVTAAQMQHPEPQPTEDLTIAAPDKSSETHQPAAVASLPPKRTVAQRVSHGQPPASQPTANRDAKPVNKANENGRSETTASPPPREPVPKAARQGQRPAPQRTVFSFNGPREPQNAPDLAHPMSRGVTDPFIERTTNSDCTQDGAALLTTQNDPRNWTAVLPQGR